MFSPKQDIYSTKTDLWKHPKRETKANVTARGKREGMRNVIFRSWHNDCRHANMANVAHCQTNDACYKEYVIINIYTYMKM